MAVPTTPAWIRFLSFRDPKPDSCWPWLGTTAGTKSQAGYFRHTTSRHDPKVRAPRYAYTTFVTPVPESLDIDHLCRNTLCVNPEHLEPVPHRENMRRARLDRCRSGRHDLTDPANVRWDRNGNRRGCIVCHREKARERARRKAGQ